MAIELDSPAPPEPTSVERTVPSEPTWFPDEHTTPEAAKAWIREHSAWAFSDDGDSDDEDGEYC